MPADDRIRNRHAEFARNDNLESLLGTLNEDLALAEAQAMQRYLDQQPPFPPIFVMGAPRSGTTLFMQWLASTGVFAYPTNMLSRFWAAPITGARIQKALTDPAYDFRDELRDFKGGTDFESHHGKTAGALSPNEFWYFWRRFMPGNEYRPRHELERTVDNETLRTEIAGITDLFGKPFATKGMIFNENIPYMADILPNAIFVWVRRQPEYNIQSLLQARERQYGDMNQWYSFKIREFDKLKDLPPTESVSGQVASIHHAIEEGFSSLTDNRKLIVDYETFCSSPSKIYEELATKLCTHEVVIPQEPTATQFNPRNEWRLGSPTYSMVHQAYKTFSHRA
ncbi:sulfotransferase family protein [Halovibrio salipaludis]|uniref:Sulfotransferase family protein n=1 Tax=Halovibrio salipaludis TaxID=2032626 RepID=A0A2A2EWW1_9GAMM|nr:sulfotransferase [Halovibrio salipaludis]PAU77901.1 sulfotransferase family protein [Halovibrio salipaludis]